MMASSTRIHNFSYIRATACIAIIVLHTVYTANMLFESTLTVSQNIISRIVVNNMMWAVPCFIMVTGALLLDKQREITYKKLFGKYILRVTGALVIFSVLFRFFDIIMDKEAWNVKTVLQGAYELFTGTGWSHMWYLYLLIGLYLLLPFYKKIVNYSSGQELKYLLLVYFVFLSLLPLTQMLELNCGFYIHVSTIYPFYLFAGYMIHNDIFHMEKWKIALAVILCTAAISLLTGMRWTKDMMSLDALWKYSSPLVIAQSIGIFALFDKWKTGPVKFIGRLLLKIDENSFGIYLIHVMFVRIILRYMSFNPYTHGGAAMLLLLVIVILAASYAAVWVLKKLPVFKKIL